MNKCPECQGERYSIDSRTGEFVCRKCGLVIEDSPFEVPYVNDVMKERAETPCLLKAGGKEISGKVIRKHWMRSTKEKNMRDMKDKLDLLSSQLKLTERAKKDAFFFFRQAVELKLNVGRGNMNLLCACIYASCLLHKTPKTFDEIKFYTDIKKRKLFKPYMILKKRLNLEMEQVNPEDFIPRFSSILKLKQSTITKAYEILHKLDGHYVMSGWQARTIASCVIYLATKLNNDFRPQREVSNATHVIETTLRRRCRELSVIIK